MARFENGMSKTSIFQRRIISRSKSSHTVPTFLKEHEQNSRNMGMKSPPSPPLPGSAGRQSSSIYMSWWMPLPPLTPTTPHQTSSIGPNNKKESAFQFPSKSPLPYDGHEEYSKAMADGIDSVPRSKCETDQERKKHHRVVRTNSSPAAVTFLPPIPKGPVCLVATRGLTEDHTSKTICDSPSPRTRRENEILENFFCGLEEPSEEDNDYDLTLSPTVAEINFFLDKLASGRPYREENNQILYEENENESDVKESKSIGVCNSNFTATLPQVQLGINQKQTLKSRKLPESMANMQMKKYSLLPPIEKFKARRCSLEEVSFLVVEDEAEKAVQY